MAFCGRVTRALTLLLAFLTLFPGETGARLVPRDVLKDRALADALFTNGVLLKLQIEIPATNVAQLRKDSKKYVTGILREGDAIFKDIAIRLKGSAGSFRQIDDKPGFTISFSTFESGTNFHGLEKFHLNNSVQDGTYLSDWLCAELFRRAGVPAKHFAHALVELNGRKLGLYTLSETEDADFLSRYFTNTKGNLYGQSGGCEVTDAIERMEGRGPLDRADLKALSAAVLEPDPAKRWEALQKNLDLERFLSFMALEVMLCDWDGYVFARHNYRVYQDLDTGRMVFIPHDKDQMIGDANLPFMANVNGLVSVAVMNTPQARLRYRERFGTILTNIFKPVVLTNDIAQLVAKLLPALTNYDKNFARDFVNNANGLRDRILNRRQGLEEQFRLPAPKLLQFTTNTARLEAWEAHKEHGNVKLEAKRAENKMLLHIHSEGGGCAASWRTSLVLGPGSYRFSGLAKSVELDPHGSEMGTGGGLRISGGPRKNKMERTTEWTRLEHDFTLDSNGEVVLVCELRAGRGEIWFDADSLQLEKLK